MGENQDVDTGYMKQAFILAREAKEDGELPFGAVIVQNGKVISAGRCREKKEKTVLAHAELEAVNNACRKLKTTKLSDCTIYCTNEPCAMCAAAMFQAKIPTVVIGASREDLAYLRPRSINIQALADDSGYKIKITRDIMKKEVLKLHSEVNNE